MKIQIFEFLFFILYFPISHANHDELILNEFLSFSQTTYDKSFSLFIL